MRDEIIAGLKNALERGESMDSAVQSFLSAGYNPESVKEAAASLSSGVSAFIPQTMPEAKKDSSTFIPKKDSSASEPPALPSTSQTIEPPKEKKSNLVLYIIIALIVIAIIGIAAVFLLDPELFGNIKSYFTN